MKLSFIIPAYNEAELITSCIESIQRSIQQADLPEECCQVIVVDNNSSDKTAALAEDAGAHVAFEPVNQISRARNAGARAASGDWLIFIDADSLLNDGLLA